MSIDKNFRPALSIVATATKRQAMLDIAVQDGLRTEFFTAPPNVSNEYLKEIVDDPYVLFGVWLSVVKCEYVWRHTGLWINFPWSDKDPVAKRNWSVRDA